MDLIIPPLNIEHTVKFEHTITGKEESITLFLPRVLDRREVYKALIETISEIRYDVYSHILSVIDKEGNTQIEVELIPFTSGIENIVLEIMKECNTLKHPNTDLAVVSSRAVISIIALLFNVHVSSGVFNEADIRPEV